MKSIQMEVLATDENFSEQYYLQANADVLLAVAAGSLDSGKHHFEAFGREEGRRLRGSPEVQTSRRAKLAQLSSCFRTDMTCTIRGGKPDYLSDELRAKTRVVDTDAVSSHSYDSFGNALIEEFANGLILDCGSGKRPIYYHNVVNYEIVDYDTTDVIGVGEMLPFVDNTFEAVISIAVLEHVRNPFACANEIVRVLKPGGKLLCSVPFLQPEHGFPNHYYNMAPQGLRALFEDLLQIDDHKVIDSMLPVWTLTWFLTSWAAGLDGAARDQFLSLKLSDVVGVDPATLLERAWVTQLPITKHFELASATLLFAHKP